MSISCCVTKIWKTRSFGSDKLQEKSAGALDLETLQLHSRLLFAQNKSAEIITLVDPAAEQFLASISNSDTARKAQLAAAVATLYTQCEQYCGSRKMVPPIA